MAAAKHQERYEHQELHRDDVGEDVAVVTWTVTYMNTSCCVIL